MFGAGLYLRLSDNNALNYYRRYFPYMPIMQANLSELCNLGFPRTTDFEYILVLNTFVL